MTHSWRSERFGRRVHLTHHAVARLQRRGLNQALLQDLIENGVVKQKNEEHWWIYKRFDGRDDNLICAAVLARQALIIKTIMTHWEEYPE
ncbi:MULTISPECIES: DUF4258 domain-containing protein [unclassified Thiocapsa]|uniref:DUF4258 domain-containing protein n=1 Tax=unclassified Thiocapsa TaxID=2641286 RepID=UPI0035B0D9AC